MSQSSPNIEKMNPVVSATKQEKGRNAKSLHNTLQYDDTHRYKNETVTRYKHGAKKPKYKDKRVRKGFDKRNFTL